MPKNRRKTLLLTFIGNDKSRIDKFFNLILQKLRENDKSVKFLKNHILKRQFFRILSDKLNNDVNSLKLGDSLILKQGDNLQFLHFYEINCDLIQNEKGSLRNLLKALNNFNQKGYLVFNIKAINSENIVSNAYFIDIRYEKDRKSLDIEEEVNNLFKCELFKKSVIRLNRLYSILWRGNLSEVFYNLTPDTDIFLSLSYYNFQDISKFSVQFHKALRLNQIEFHTLKPNLFFIEDKILFLIQEVYNPVETTSILEKFFSKYYVFILILNMDEYKKLIQSNNIRLMENIKTLNFKEFIKFNISNMKNEYVLEDS